MPEGMLALVGRLGQPINQKADAKSCFSASFQTLRNFFYYMKAKCMLILHTDHYINAISIYIPHMSLYITVMVTLSSHKLLYQSALLCSEIFKNGHGLT